MLIFFLWLTYAFFTKAFVSTVPVTLTTDTTGVNLPQNADVKLRGVIVGEVRKVEPDGAGVKLTLGDEPRADQGRAQGRHGAADPQDACSVRSTSR